MSDFNRDLGEARLHRAITDYAAIQPLDLLGMAKIQSDLRAIAGEKHVHRKTIGSDECLLCKRDLRHAVHGSWRG